MKLMPKLRGFTLIELLIVISIIAVLAAIGFVTYSSVIKSGRDSKRQSDLRSIQSALEQYHADQFYYPTVSALTFGAPLSFDSRTYMNTVPTDPIGSPQYAYTPSPAACDNFTNKCTSYCLYAKLENSNPGTGSSCTNATYNFAVTPP